jgi:hypothetical protein
MKSFTTLSNYYQSLSQNNSTVNAALGVQLINDAHRYLLQKYFFNERSTTITTVGDQQGYQLPFNYSKLKTGTITIGTLKWNPVEIMSRDDWDNLTVFPLYSDIPSNYFIYDGKFNLWPIPSTGSTAATYTGLTGTLVAGNTITVGAVVGTILTFTSSSMQIAIPQSSNGVTLPTGAFTTSNGAVGTITAVTITAGNTITFNYQIRVPDLSIADYSSGIVTVANNSTAVTGLGTSWLSQYLPVAGSVKHLNLWIQFTSPLGDGSWYQINTVNSATSITLLNNYQGGSSAGVSYTIGQMPLLLEDYHDLPAYRALLIYYSSINKDPQKAEEFKALYEMGIESLDNYAGSKALEVNLRGAIRTINPNLFPSSIG